jgi:hypothetical protein
MLALFLGASVGLPRDAVQEAARYTFNIMPDIFILKLEMLPYLVCLLQSRLFQCTSCTSRFFLVGYISYKIVNFPLLSIHCKHIVLVNTCQDI